MKNRTGTLAGKEPKQQKTNEISMNTSKVIEKQKLIFKQGDDGKNQNKDWCLKFSDIEEMINKQLNMRNIN